MKIFKHPVGNRVIFARYVLGSHEKEFKDIPFGEVFRIVEIDPSCGQVGPNGCGRSGGVNGCPGRVLLDKEPFNRICQCYSWLGKSIFDYIAEK